MSLHVEGAKSVNSLTWKDGSWTKWTRTNQQKGENEQDGKPIQWTCSREMAKYIVHLRLLWLYVMSGHIGHNWSQVVTLDHSWWHLSLLRSRTTTIMILMVIMDWCNLVTVVTVKVKNPHKMALMVIMALWTFCWFSNFAVEGTCRLHRQNGDLHHLLTCWLCRR